MTVVVLVHGAWHDGSCWGSVVPELAARGHPAVVVDLPSDRAGLGAIAYAEAIEAAIGAARTGGAADRAGAADGPVVLVGHSLGGLTVPVVAERLGPERVSELVLLCALVPQVGLSFDDQVRADPGTMAEGFGAGQRRHDDRATSWPVADAVANLYRGVAAELVEREGSGAADDKRLARERVSAAAARLRRQAWTVGREVTPLLAWPPVPTTVVVCTEDRVVAPDRLRTRARGIPGAQLVELAGGHFPMLTRPAELADLLASLAARRPS